jgi:hypothetical protein
MTRRNLTEKDVKHKGKALLEKYGWFYWMPPANQFGASGISDLHAVHNGVFMVVEFKNGANKPSALQKAFLTTIAAAGHFAFVVNDQTLVIFEAFLKAFANAQAASAKAGGDPKAVDETDGAIMLNAMRDLTRDYMDFEDQAKAATRFN